MRWSRNRPQRSFRCDILRDELAAAALASRGLIVGALLRLVEAGCAVHNWASCCCPKLLGRSGAIESLQLQLRELGRVFVFRSGWTCRGLREVHGTTAADMQARKKTGVLFIMISASSPRSRTVSW